MTVSSPSRIRHWNLSDLNRRCQLNKNSPAEMVPPGSSHHLYLSSQVMDQQRLANTIGLHKTAQHGDRIHLSFRLLQFLHRG